MTSTAFGITALQSAIAPEAAFAAPSDCSIATNGSFESPNIQDPANPQPGDAYVGGYNQYRTSQATISGWQTVAGTIDLLRYYSNASDGAQSLDLWGTAPSTIQQTFTDLTPGAEYTFSLDYSGMETGSSSGTVQLSQGGAFSTVTTLAPSSNAVRNGAYGTPQAPAFTVAWSTFEHTFTATGTSATVRIQNQVAPSAFNTGLFVDNFSFTGGLPCEDYGDAPESYGTSFAANGPAHLAVGPVLGLDRDAEWDGAPNATATGDDTAGAPNDEDSLGALSFSPGAATVTVPVTVANPTSETATLYGWIDADANGRFDATEFVSALVAPGSTSAELTFAGQPRFTGDADYMMRLRLTTDLLVDDGATPGDERALGSATDGEVEDHLVAVPVLSSLTVAKSATPAAASSVGDDITYSFLVTNTGNVTLADVTVVEGDFTGAGELSDVDCAAGAASLAPGASVTCTATYELTQTDVDAGSISNTATATATPPSGPTPVSPSSTTVVQIPPAPGLSVVKSATPSEAGEFLAGQEIDYSFVVTNTGNTTLSNVAVDEVSFTGTGDAPVVSCPVGAASLAPGAQVVCTAEYTLTQADVDAGSLTNSASATATPPSGPPLVSPPSAVTVPSIAAPAMTVVKTADTDSLVAAGQDVTYSFLVTNTGNVTLNDVAVNETDFTGAGDLAAVVCPTDTLLPGQFTVCTTTYSAAQADIDEGGELSNTATAGAVDPAGDAVSSAPSTSVIPIDQAAGLTVVKTSDVVAAAVGQTVTYSFVVSNTGNVTITDPTVNEIDFSGTGELSAVTCPEGDTLAPGDEITCTATYEVTQADVDSGELTNTATATGTTPSGEPTEPSTPSTSIVTTDPLPAMSVVKTADVERIVAVGQVVTYTFIVTNTGNVTITDPAVNEGDFNGKGDLSSISCPEGSATLDPGEAAACTATYTVVEADLAGGGTLSNTATVSGTTPTGDSITSSSSTAVVDAVAPSAGAAPLPATGGEIAAWVLMTGVGLLVGGAILVMLRRRTGSVAAE
ncbi:GEVED domain-containing protein [Microbacterium sp.]|uniref:DUF7507 domain-containing protein n=1 Tax=Microbacterium sp. TaxID=51671 RepID=UPI0028118E7D|nr:GEVED domain-containing protein [Microbacterium sp.]